MYAVAVDWLDPDTCVACGFCNKIVAEVYSLNPINGEEYQKLEKTLGDVSNWRICNNCLGKLEKKTGCKIEVTDVETVAEYEYKHYEKKDLAAVAVAVKKINEKLLLCPVCKKEMDMRISSRDLDNIDTHCKVLDKTDIHSRMYKDVRVKCKNCGFEYSKDKIYTIAGSIIGHIDKVIIIEYTDPPKVDLDGNVDMPELEYKRVIYQHDNFDQDALRVLSSLSELLTFLVIDDKIVRILTG